MTEIDAFTYSSENALFLIKKKKNALSLSPSVSLRLICVQLRLEAEGLFLTKRNDFSAGDYSEVREGSLFVSCLYAVAGVAEGTPRNRNDFT